ncbi:hypothetical protein HHA01_27290 [Halomonas halmophila]|uniref:Aminotransferase class I/classII domain-containing protein n=1 Tax=Halomonas halmophila TaxID=252 RepID=A0A4Y4F0H9_9GAMM|nr:hypothetical protein HHA01_27290 [Halomonas halmophila]
MPGNVFRAPYPNPLHGISEEHSLDAIRTLFKTDIPASQTAAMVIEPVQGEGGFYANTIRILVPLTVEQEVLNEGLDIIEQALHTIA